MGHSEACLCATHRQEAEQSLFCCSESRRIGNGTYEKDRWGNGVNSPKSKRVTTLVKLIKQIIPYLLCYLLWVITAALAFLNLLVARRLFLVLLSVFSVSSWSATAIDKVSFIFLGVVWLGLVVFSEYYYLHSISKNRLWKSFSLVTGIQLLFLFAVRLTPSLIVGVRQFTWVNYLLSVGELGGGIVLLVIAFHSSSHRSAIRISGRRNKIV